MRDNPAVRKMLSMAMWMLLLVAPIQAVIGDFHGLNTASTSRPSWPRWKGTGRTKAGEAVPLLLFGIPDMEAEKPATPSASRTWAA
jgi:cytochrome d ubiquinol oxidase subunit I